MVLFIILLGAVASVCSHQVNANCQIIDWSYSFKKKPLSECSNNISHINYIRGFVINGKNGQLNKDIGLLEGAECCTPQYTWKLSKLQTVHVNWWISFDSQGSVSCPEGFFLRGLFRSLASPGYLNHIEEGRCTKPADHPRYYNGNCLNVDISSCTSGKGLCKCPYDYFVAGLFRDECHELRCLKKLKCCKMWDEPKDFLELDDVKERIMDITHSNLALLGHYLGYGWTAGCMEPYVGEGFKRVNDTMEADKSFRCFGYKHDQRLKLIYSNWSFELKNITYGEPIIDLLKPETMESGIVVNNDTSPTMISNVITITAVRAVTHTVANSWKHAHTLGIKLSYTFDINVGVYKSSLKSEVSYNFQYEKATTTTDSSNHQDSRQFSTTVSKEMPPSSRKKWSVALSKTRKALPYTAVVLVKFSVDFHGFLRALRGSRNHQNFNYNFGDASEPFYSALNKQSSRNSGPWKWYDLKEQYPYLQPLVDDLTKESHYEFTLSGKFEDVMGTLVEQRWDDLGKTDMETLTLGSSDYKMLKIKRVHIAQPAHDDVPAEVIAPKVVLDSAKLCDFDAPVNMTYLQ